MESGKSVIQNNDQNSTLHANLYISLLLKIWKRKEQKNSHHMRKEMQKAIVRSIELISIILPVSSISPTPNLERHQGRHTCPTLNNWSAMHI